MKPCEEIERRLRLDMPTLRERFKVKRIGIFGSYVRNEQTESSDVDLLVDFSEPVGWEFVDLKEHLETVLGLKVDLVTVGALRPEYRDRVLAEVAYA